MRQILLAGKESQKRTPLFRDVIADRALQHRKRRLHRVQHRPLRYRAFHLNFHFAPDVCQRSKVLR